MIIDDRRGMATLLRMLGPRSPAMRAAEALLSSRQRALLCTGFPVDDASESDGPAGAIVLGNALRELAREVVVVSWAEALESWAPALGDLPTLAIARHSAPSPLQGAAVTIEVCGRVPDGSYCNMHGVDVRARTPAFEAALGAHALVSVGDGGNEFGMGAAPSSWFAERSVVRPISTCEVLVVGQVSNWAVLAMVACLGQLTGRDLLPARGAYQELLEGLAQAGVVDGVERRAQPTEDGFELGRGESMVHALREWQTGASELRE